jgi:hypothetical protein
VLELLTVILVDLVFIAICGVSLEWVCGNAVDLFMSSDYEFFAQILEFMKKYKNYNLYGHIYNQEILQNMYFATWTYI